MRKIVLGGLVFGLLVGCGGAQLPEADVQKTTDPIQSRQIELVPLETKPFEQQKLWDYVRDGRPTNAYSLVYAKDHEVCSLLTNALNKPLLIKPYYRHSQRVALKNIRLFLGTKFSVEWISISPTGTLSYTESDLNHDGVKEYYSRRYPRNTRATQMLIENLSFQFNKIENESRSDRSRRFKLLMSKHGYGSHEYLTDSVDFGTSTNDEKIRAYRDYFGQFIEIAEIDGKGYLLVGGNIHLKAVQRDDGSFEPVSQLVRVLKKKPLNQIKGYSLVCELRPNFVNALTTMENDHAPK